MHILISLEALFSLQFLCIMGNIVCAFSKFLNLSPLIWQQEKIIDLKRNSKKNITKENIRKINITSHSLYKCHTHTITVLFDVLLLCKHIFYESRKLQNYSSFYLTKTFILVFNKIFCTFIFIFRGIIFCTLY